MIHLVKVDGTEVLISKEELEKIIHESLPLEVVFSMGGDKIIIYDPHNFYLGIPDNEKVMKLTSVEILLELICGDAIVISLV